MGPGVAPESDAGVFALLGYDPVRDSPGRGVLEALGVEIPLAPEDVALRLNFATLDGDGSVLDSRVGRSLSTKEAVDLAFGLTSANLLAPEEIRAEVRATVGHRGVWLHPLGGGSLSPEVSNADPFYEKVGGMGQARRPEAPKLLEVTPTDASGEAARTARAINLFLDRARPVLAGHRAERPPSDGREEDCERPPRSKRRKRSLAGPTRLVRGEARGPRSGVDRDAGRAGDRPRAPLGGLLRWPHGA